MTQQYSKHFHRLGYLLGLALLAFGLAAHAQSILPRQFSTACSKVVNPTASTAPASLPAEPPLTNGSTHQYLLLLLFKPGTGASYFGSPGKSDSSSTVREVGCLENARKQATQPPFLMVQGSCPRDCDLVPIATAAVRSNDRSPLGLAGVDWGIGDEDEALGPMGHRNFEIWQIPVSDEAHALDILKMHSKHFLGTKKSKDYLGYAIVGFRVRGAN